MASETPGFSMADRRKHVRTWKKSGLTAREYAERVGLNHWTLHGWATRLNRKHDKQTQEPAVRFVPATVVETAAEVPSEPIELLLANGRRLRVGAHFDEAVLHRLITVVEGS